MWLAGGSEEPREVQPEGVCAQGMAGAALPDLPPPRLPNSDSNLGCPP